MQVPEGRIAIFEAGAHLRGLRERLGLSDNEFESFDRDAHNVVDEALEFAQNGTDPQPEDALKNVYA